MNPPIPYKITVSKWIVVGTVRPAYIRVINCGYPGCLTMRWRGRGHVFQTVDFLGWGHLLPAVHGRLRMARLEAVAIACSIPPPGSEEMDLLCLVKPAQRANLNQIDSN